MLRSAPALPDAIRLLSAIGDALGGYPAGFSMRVAAVAARFAAHRGAESEAVAATYYAAALHALGLVRVAVTPGATERDAEIARWDAPVHGAAIVASIPGLPRGTSDNVRWHRESFDGTGFPDRLRWNGIPQGAMTINIARAFVAALHAQGGVESPAEALFAVIGESGRTYDVNAGRAFREFVSSAGSTFHEPVQPAWTLKAPGAQNVVVALCAEIDARDPATAGRGERVERLVRAVAGQPAVSLDVERAAFAARLTSLGRVRAGAHIDDFDPLARLGRDARAGAAADAARILRAAPAFAPFADIVGATAEWYDGSGLPDRRKGDAIDPAARLIAVALAADALEGSSYADAAHGFPDAATRIGAAAGTQFDPTVVSAYLRAVGNQPAADDGHASA
ncbi:MAG: HD domain-containing phosphohydrolase [Candidatus Velthaea sp.]